MTLRSRLAIAFGVVAFLVSVVVGVSSFRATSGEVSSSTDSFLVTRALSVLDGRREAPRRADGERQDRSPNGLAVDPDAIVQVVNETGEPVISSGATLPVTDGTRRSIERTPRSPRVALATGVFDDVVVDGEAYRMYSVALPQGGALQVARSIQADDDLLRSLFRRFALIAVVVTAVASLVGWWIARSATRPLRRLAGVASGVADTGDLTVTVPVDGDDEIAQLARSLRTMLNALDTSRRQQHRLVQDAGHELRTPLTSLRANVSMLERIEAAPDRSLPPGERAAVLAAISAEVAELGSLFDELVDLAGDGAERGLVVAPVRLDEVARAAVATWEQRTGRTIEVRTEPVTVDGDAGLLERAVTNLIGNAHKFSPADEPIQVSVEVASDVLPADGASASGRRSAPPDRRSFAVVAVRDGGPGIPVEDRPLVFDRFHRATASRSMPGSGLGLAIVDQVVRQHGGTTWVGESDRGGAEVGFRLPVAQDLAREV